MYFPLTLVLIKGSNRLTDVNWYLSEISHSTCCSLAFFFEISLTATCKKCAAIWLGLAIRFRAFCHFLKCTFSIHLLSSLSSCHGLEQHGFCKCGFRSGCGFKLFRLDTVDGLTFYQPTNSSNLFVQEAFCSTSLFLPLHGTSKVFCLVRFRYLDLSSSCPILWSLWTWWTFIDVDASLTWSKLWRVSCHFYDLSLQLLDWAKLEY